MSTVSKNNMAGIRHLEAISDILQRPIEVFDEEGHVRFTIGSSKIKTPLKIQYHCNEKHYTILDRLEPFARGTGDNMCLYNCISDQAGMDPDALKASTMDFLKGRVLRCEVIGSDLCLGGAAYHGLEREDAAWYLDGSQDVRGYRHYRPGHPRHHASNPGGVGVEAASKVEGHKTGFESYEEQDFAAHFALQTRKAREGMESLNGGKSRVDMHITRRELCMPRTLSAGRWENGTRRADFEVAAVVLVLQHHEGQYANENAPVHIQTFYPRPPD